MFTIYRDQPRSAYPNAEPLHLGAVSGIHPAIRITVEESILGCIKLYGHKKFFKCYEQILTQNVGILLSMIVNNTAYKFLQIGIKKSLMKNFNTINTMTCFRKRMNIK